MQNKKREIAIHIAPQVNKTFVQVLVTWRPSTTVTTTKDRAQFMISHFVCSSNAILNEVLIKKRELNPNTTHEMITNSSEHIPLMKVKVLVHHNDGESFQQRWHERTFAIPSKGDNDTHTPLLLL